LSEGRDRSRSGGWENFDTGSLTLEQRRTIFFGLATAAAFTLLLGFAYRVLLRVHLGVDVALAGYVVYLVRTRPRREPTELVTYHTPSNRRPEVRERDRDDHREWLRAGEL
jgi:uncharacterized membrane protein